MSDPMPPEVLYHGVPVPPRCLRCFHGGRHATGYCACVVCGCAEFLPDVDGRVMVVAQCISPFEEHGWRTGKKIVDALDAHAEAQR